VLASIPSGHDSKVLKVHTTFEIQFVLFLSEHFVLSSIKGSVSRDFLGLFLACMDRSRSV
jgi:hypothetical protein